MLGRSINSMSRAQNDLNRLKEIVIDPFDRVGSVRGHRHAKFDHEFGQPGSVYQDDLASDLRDVIICVFGKVRRSDEYTFGRVLTV
jgi:hypothetical protein